MEEPVSVKTWYDLGLDRASPLQNYICFGPWSRQSHHETGKEKRLSKGVGCGPSLLSPDIFVPWSLGSLDLDPRSSREHFTCSREGRSQISVHQELAWRESIMNSGCTVSKKSKMWINILFHNVLISLYHTFSFPIWLWIQWWRCYMDKMIVFHKTINLKSTAVHCLTQHNQECHVS